MKKDFRKILIGAAIIVIQALIIGLVANLANPQGVTFFRSPLRDASIPHHRPSIVARYIEGAR